MYVCMYIDAMYIYKAHPSDGPYIIKALLRLN
jgi:hypothetical protein